MKKIIICAATCVFLIACKEDEKNKTTYVKGSDTTVTSGGDTAGMETASVTAASAGPVDTATMMKNWQAYMTPSAAHKLMSSWNGKWEGDVTMWQTPDAPAVKSKSTSVNKMILGDRYQQGSYKGNMMGMPFEGMSMMGYDNFKKVFTSTWIDNLGTGTMIMEGPWDEATKTLTLTGKAIDPTGGNAKEVIMRETYKVIDDNTHVMEMFSSLDGKEYKNMEIKLVRK